MTITVKIFDFHVCIFQIYVISEVNPENFNVLARKLTVFFVSMVFNKYVNGAKCCSELCFSLVCNKMITMHTISLNFDT